MCDSVGLMDSESKDGTNISHTISLDQWNIGGVVYDIDTLGRVIKKDNRVFIYGENGRISKLRGHYVNQSDYFYDEENNPILKISKFGMITVYLGDNAYLDDNFYEPIKVGTRIVGYFKNGVFVSSSQDHLNTNVVDETGVVNLATAYGERLAPRTDVNEVMDFTLKGFDQDLDAVRMGHRYYDPIAKMFYSADEFFLESPEKILKSPVEGNLYSYAGNEPVGNKDSNGDFAIAYGPSISISLGKGIEISKQAAISINLNPFSKGSFKIETGTIETKTLKFGINAGASINRNLTFFFGNSDLRDLKGTSFGGNVSIPIHPAIPGIGLAGGSSASNTPVASLNLSKGTPTEINLGVNLQETKVELQKTIFEGFNTSKSDVHENIPSNTNWRDPK